MSNKYSRGVILPVDDFLTWYLPTPIAIDPMQKKVSDEFINRIGRIPNFEWIPLAWQLKLQKQDIREISKNIVSQPDKVRAMLMKWRDNSKAQKTTYNYFINVLLQNFCADLAWNACNLIKGMLPLRL